MQLKLAKKLQKEKKNMKKLDNTEKWQQFQIVSKSTTTGGKKKIKKNGKVFSK